MAYPWAPAPPLPPRHAQALAEALALLDRCPDLTGVLLAGSVVGGSAGPTSDLDLLCVTSGDVRQRRHLVASTRVLVEMFLNPPRQIRSYLADERRRNRPSTATMLATGRVLLDREPEVLTCLRREAETLLAKGPDPLAGPSRDRALYIVRDAFEDAVDAEAAGGAGALLPLAHCAAEALSLHYTLRRRWQPKTKNLAADLAGWDAEAARLLAAFATRPDLGALRALVAHVLEADGGLPIRSFDGPVLPVAP